MLKKMKKKIATKTPLTIEEQKFLYEQWDAIINKGQGPEEPSQMPPTKRSRQAGEGTSGGGARSDASEDEHQGGRGRGRATNKEGRK